MATVKNIPPSGTIKLYGGIDIGNGRQPIFSSRANQIAYYNKHLVKQIDGMSYMRMGDRIKIEATVDEMAGVNFMSFTNRMGGEEREIYCYIDPNWEYINNNTIAIAYTIASFQTMMFDVTFKPGVISREHLSSSEWDRAVSNPYTGMIQSLLTEEPLQMSMDLEDPIVGYDETGFPDGLMMFPENRVTGANVDNGLLMLVGNGSFSDITGWDDLMDRVTDAGGIAINTLNNAGSWAEISGIPAPAIAYLIYLPLGGNNSVLPTNTMIWDDIFDTLVANQMTGNIIGLYYLPPWFIENIINVDFYGDTFPTGDTDGTTAGWVTFEDTYKPRNPKLYRYPYHYIRVSTFEGNSKNYILENFVELEVADTADLDLAKFYLICNINGNPTISLAPRGYRHYPYYAQGWISALNFEEMVSYDNVPHVPYVTDGYLAYVTAQASNVLRNTSRIDAFANSARTFADNHFAIQDILLSPFDWLSGSIGNLSGAVGSADPVGTVNALYGSARSAGKYQQNNVNNAINILSSFSQNNKKSTLAGYNAANSFYDSDRTSTYNLGIPENAYKTLKADNIFLGSGNGFEQYLTQAPFNFLMKEVRPRPEVLSIYDKWLDYYGYASNRIGVPHVVSYFQGGDDQPHFAEVDGDTVTYAKARVFCYGNSKAPKMMCDDIEQMFANGTLFVKKD